MSDTLNLLIPGISNASRESNESPDFDSGILTGCLLTVSSLGNWRAVTPGNGANSVMNWVTSPAADSVSGVTSCKTDIGPGLVL